MQSRKEARITFTQYDAAHLYELALEHFCVSKKSGVCHECVILKRRIEEFVGRKEIKQIQRRVKKHGYCKN